MKKISIIYVSVHHQNTAKLISDVMPMIEGEVESINLLNNKEYELPDSDLIIFASGIYFNNMHKSLIEYIDVHSFEGRNVMALYTCGSRYRNHAKGVRKQLIGRGALYVGTSYSKGFDTFGILKKIGGISKGHPNKSDAKRVAKDINNIVEKL